VGEDDKLEELITSGKDFTEDDVAAAMDDTDHVKWLGGQWDRIKSTVGPAAEKLGDWATNPDSKVEVEKLVREHYDKAVNAPMYKRAVEGVKGLGERFRKGAEESAARRGEAPAKKSRMRTSVDIAMMDVVEQYLHEDAKRTLDPADKAQLAQDMKDYLLHEQGRRSEIEGPMRSEESRPARLTDQVNRAKGLGEGSDTSPNVREGDRTTRAEPIPGDFVRLFGENARAAMSDGTFVLGQSEPREKVEQHFKRAYAETTRQARGRYTKLEETIHAHMRSDGDFLTNKAKRDQYTAGFIDLLNDTNHDRVGAAAALMFDDPDAAIEAIDAVLKRKDMSEAYRAATREELEDLGAVEETPDEFDDSFAKDDLEQGPSGDARARAYDDQGDAVAAAQAMIDQYGEKVGVRVRPVYRYEVVANVADDRATTYDVKEEADAEAAALEAEHGPEAMVRVQQRPAGYEVVVGGSKGDSAFDDRAWERIKDRGTQSGFEHGVITVNTKQNPNGERISIPRLTAEMKRTIKQPGRGSVKYDADMVMQGLAALLADPRVKMDRPLGKKTAEETGFDQDKPGAWDIPDETQVTVNGMTWGDVKAALAKDSEFQAAQSKADKHVQAAQEAASIEWIRKSPRKQAGAMQNELTPPADAAKEALAAEMATAYRPVGDLTGEAKRQAQLWNKTHPYDEAKQEKIKELRAAAKRAVALRNVADAAVEKIDQEIERRTMEGDTPFNEIGSMNVDQSMADGEPEPTTPRVSDELTGADLRNPGTEKLGKRGFDEHEVAFSEEDRAGGKVVEKFAAGPGKQLAELVSDGEAYWFRSASGKTSGKTYASAQEARDAARAGYARPQPVAEPKEARPQPGKDIGTVPMYYKMPVEGLRADLRAAYPNGTTTAQLIDDGKRTATTRKPFAAVGDFFRINGVQGEFKVVALDTVDLATPGGRETWSKREGWDVPYAQHEFQGQVKSGAIQTVFERVHDEVTDSQPGAAPKEARPQPARVELPKSSPYVAKDQAKSDKANKFIGRGSARSSTAAYAKAWGDRANTGKYEATDVVFVSAEGNRPGRIEPDFAEIGKAAAAKATMVTDDKVNRERRYNVGERAVANFLEKRGYREAEPGVWKPEAETKKFSLIETQKTGLLKRMVTMDKAAWTEYVNKVSASTNVKALADTQEYLKSREFTDAMDALGEKEWEIANDRVAEFTDWVDAALKNLKDDGVKFSKMGVTVELHQKSLDARKAYATFNNSLAANPTRAEMDKATSLAHDAMVAALEDLTHDVDSLDEVTKARARKMMAAKIDEVEAMNAKVGRLELPKDGSFEGKTGASEYESQKAWTQASNNLRALDQVTVDIYDMLAKAIRSKLPADATKPLDAKTRKEIKAYVKRVLGKDARALFEKMAHAGEFANIGGVETLRIAIKAADHWGAARHEAAHALFARLMKADKAAANQLLAAAGAPTVVSRLRNLLKDHPEALKQLADPEERVAYMYQFWAAGHLEVGPKTRTWLEKVRAFFRVIAGLWSETARNATNARKAEQIMDLFHRGDLSDRNAVAEALRDKSPKTALEHATTVMGPLYKWSEKVWFTADGIVRDMNIPAFTEVADKVFNQHGESGYNQTKHVVGDRFVNRAATLLDKVPEATRRKALEALQSGTKSTDPKVAKIVDGVREILKDAFDYMKSKGVKAVVWSDSLRDYQELEIQFVKDYFPRYYDKVEIRTNRRGFVEMLRRNKIGEDEAERITERLLKSSKEAPDENDDVVGLTYYAPNTMSRKLDIPGSELAPFLRKDLYEQLGSYLHYAARRGEYASRFGNQGQEIVKAVAKGREQGATEEQVATFERATRAWEGSLGNDISDEMRRFYGGVVLYQNIRLLPLALFSSLPDSLGIMVRGGTLADAAGGFVRGIRGLVDEQKDRGYDLARDIGAIATSMDAHMVADGFGSQYLSKTQRKWSAKFFEWNGMEAWNRSMRVAAVLAAEKFVVRHAGEGNEHSARYLAELGLTKADVKVDKAGHLVVNDKVRDALNQWVDGAVLRPNSSMRPIWMSDPHWMVVSHLKQYTYSFQKTIIARVVHEAEHGNYTPAYSMVSYVPAIIAADMLRVMMTPGGGDDDYLKRLTTGETVMRGIERAGLFGPGAYALDAFGDMGHERPPMVSFLGPTVQQMYDLASPRGGMGHELAKATPGYVLVK